MWWSWFSPLLTAWLHDSLFVAICHELNKACNKEVINQQNEHKCLELVPRALFLQTFAERLLFNHCCVWSSPPLSGLLWWRSLAAWSELSWEAASFLLLFLLVLCTAAGFEQGCNTSEMSWKVQRSSLNTCSCRVNWPCFVRVSSRTWAYEDRAAESKHTRPSTPTRMLNHSEYELGQYWLRTISVVYLFLDHPPGFWHKTHHHTRHLLTGKAQ